MRTPAGWPTALAFWTFLVAVTLIVLAPDMDGGNSMGTLALLLLSVSHTLPLIDVFRTA